MKRLFSHPRTRGLYGIFNDSFPPILDGVTLTVENYVYWLQKKGMTPCVVTPWNPEKHEYPFEVMRYFSLPIRTRYPYRYGYPKCDPFIWRRLRNTDFRILHSHCPFSSGRLAVYIKNRQHVPLVGTFHSKYRDDLRHSFRNFPWMVTIIMRRILNFFNSCDEVWIPQAHVEKTVREYGYTGPLTVVENGNDFASIISGDLRAYKDEAKRRIGTSSEELGLLFVGQHIWEKGLDVILDALRIIRDKMPFRMNFIGTGYAFDEINSRIRAYGLEDRVKLHGVIKEREMLSDYYAGSDLFLFPSFYDNAPLVVREAAAMGTPSILLRDSTASEVIKEDVNGFLTSKDATDFARKIEDLYNHREFVADVGKNARASLVRSWENVVDEVMVRYSEIIERYKKN